MLCVLFGVRLVFAVRRKSLMCAGLVCCLVCDVFVWCWLLFGVCLLFGGVRRCLLFVVGCVLQRHVGWCLLLVVCCLLLCVGCCALVVVRCGLLLGVWCWYLLVCVCRVLRVCCLVCGVRCNSPIAGCFVLFVV